MLPPTNCAILGIEMEVFVSVFVLLAMVNAESLFRYEVFPANVVQLEQIKRFGDTQGAIFGKSARFSDSDYPVTLWLPPSAEETFTDFLMCGGMNFNVVADGQSALQHPYKKKLRKGAFNFETYHRHHVINAYLHMLALQYPHLVTLENAGKSAEGRDLLAVKISTGGNGTKPLILIEAGMHAVEWISSVQALYIIQQLVENRSLRYLTENVDWLIFPVVNPDGYEFTLTVSKKWRKTRSRGVNCFGTDGNRNFDFHWAEVGTSWNECHPIYHGPRPFSEPETQALRNLVLKYAHRVKLYLSLHSFGQFILYPWAHTYVPAANAAELNWLAKRAAAAIERFGGSQYSVGSIPRMLYLSSGDSTSWAKGVAGVDLAYVIELPPKMDRFPPTTTKDSEIPPKCIKFVVEEVLQGVKVFHGYVEYKYAKK